MMDTLTAANKALEYARVMFPDASDFRLEEVIRITKPPEPFWDVTISFLLDSSMEGGVEQVGSLGSALARLRRYQRDYKTFQLSQAGELVSVRIRNPLMPSPPSSS